MHEHAELILAAPSTDEPDLQAAIEPAMQRVEWQVGGRYRGAHEPAGPFRDLDVVQEDLGGGTFVRYTQGRTGIGKIDDFCLARPADVLRLSDQRVKAFLAEGPAPRVWLRAVGDGHLEIEKQEVLSLVQDSSELILVTLDLHV